MPVAIASAKGAVQVRAERLARDQAALEFSL